MGAEAKDAGAKAGDVAELPAMVDAPTDHLREARAATVDQGAHRIAPPDRVRRTEAGQPPPDPKVDKDKAPVLADRGLMP